MTAGSFLPEELPIGWSSRRLRTLGSFNKGFGGSKEDNRETGVPVVRYGDLYTTFNTVITKPVAYVDDDVAARYAELPTGTLVLTASGEDPEEIGKAALSQLSGRAVVGGDAILFSPGPEVDGLFLSYVLQSSPLRGQKAIRSTGFTVVHITAGRLKTLVVPLPPLPEQRAIAEFLDRETAKIDTLIEKQNALIERLRERRTSWHASQAEHNHGKGPRLKWSFREIDERAAYRVDLPLLSVSIDWGVRRRDEVGINQAASEDLSRYKIASAGDLVINRMRAFQGALGVAPETGLVSPDYAVIRCSDAVHPEWLAGVMRSLPFVGDMVSRLRGIGTIDGSNVRTPRVGVADLGDIPVKIPSLEQQLQDLERSRSETVEIDLLIAKAERFVELARERRAALITAAVTGQLDVEGAA